MNVKNNIHGLYFQNNQPTTSLYIIIVIVLAAALRILQISDRPLWYDELQSVTHASLPIWDLLISTFRYDPHPPLHILQLSFWLTWGTDDAWIRMNSVLWSLLTFIPLYFLGCRLVGRFGAIISLIIFAISPMAIFYAQEVRPYAMQIFLITLSIYLLEIAIDNQKKIKYTIYFAVSLLMTFYSQGASFLLFIPFLLYTLMRLGGIRQVFPLRNNPILISEFIVLVLTLPWILIAINTSVGHLSSPDSMQVAHDVTALVFGPSHGISTEFSYFIAIFIMALIVPSSKIRTLALCFIITPITIAIFLSIAVRPIWHIRLISVCLTPISLCTSGLFVWLQTRIVRFNYLVIVLLAILTLSVVPFSLAVNKNTLERTAYFDAAQFLHERTKAGETIAFQNQRDAWGVSWYLAGPGKLRTVAPKQEIRTQNGQIILYGHSVDNTIGADVIVFRNDVYNKNNTVKFGNIGLAFSEALQ